jgi:hypothetical protein
MQIRKGTDVSHIAHLLGVPCGAATPRASTWPRDHFCQKTMGPPCALRLGDRTGEVLGRGVLLVFGAPDQLPSLVGQDHGRTIPLPEVEPCCRRGLGRSGRAGWQSRPCT